MPMARSAGSSDAVAEDSHYSRVELEIGRLFRLALIVIIVLIIAICGWATLSKITVKGRIGGAGHEIQADLGLFSVKDETGTWLIAAAQDHWFDGLHAYVG